ncbi:segregation/condensation protein A [bacterium]|nr:segregation/condensation protein A [bacterium]
MNDLTTLSHNPRERNELDDFRCRIRLEQFDGPLDLLLYLIRKNEIDIYDIPIVYVTKQYIDYLDMMKKINLDIAGEYLVMAATLLEIKSRMLLPKPLLLETGEEEDPRSELVNMLLEYEKYKNVAELLKSKGEQEEQYFCRGSYPELDYMPTETPLAPMSIYELLRIANEVFQEEVEEIPDVLRESINVEERIEYIMEIMEAKEKLQFLELFSGTPTRMILVPTFVAILELVRRHCIKLRQIKQFGNIWLYLNTQSSL